MSPRQHRKPPRKHLEHELRDAVARYEAILASTQDPVITVDARGIIQAVSDSVHRVFGWMPQELIGHDVSVLMPEPHRTRHDEYMGDFRRTGVAGILGRTREFEALRKDGTRLPIELSVSRVDLPDDERPLFTGIIRDITDRKRVERALQESERRFREILEQVELVAVMLDTDGAVTFCNDHMLRLTGWKRRDVLGHNWFRNFLPPDDGPQALDAFKAGVEQGAILAHHEDKILTRHGEPRIIAWSNTVLRDLHGAIIGVTGIGADITEQRRAEEELREYRAHLEELVAERTGELEASHEQLRLADRLASIGTLAAGLGHDMNNVLLPIRFRLDALNARDLPDEAQKHFAEVGKSVEYLQQLADGLHLLSLDPEDAEASAEGTDVAAWWEQVGTLLARGLPKHVRLATSWPSNLPLLAVAPHRLTQAVLNLVVNAGEAVGDDGKVRVWAEPFEDHRFVRLGVTDNGHGMTAQVKRRALDPFFTTKTRGLGTGLGLSLVQGVARSAGGTVQVDSAPGQGATIVLTLPAHHAEDVSPRTSLEPVLNALVSIEDQRIASFVGTVLGASGFEVTYDAAGHLDESELWITDPTPGAMEQARQYLAGSRRKVLVVGRATAEWLELGAIVVEDPMDFEGLRERIHEAAVSLAGGGR
ncbi:MAG: PAS domain-containing sensor histidine kinase [Planctomycetota bacterium]|jgi:PAS domain S-box-containing protein